MSRQPGSSADAEHVIDVGRFNQDLAAHAASGFLAGLGPLPDPGQSHDAPLPLDPGQSHDLALPYDPGQSHDVGLPHDPGASHDPGPPHDPGHDPGAHLYAGPHPDPGAHHDGSYPH